MAEVDAVARSNAATTYALGLKEQPKRQCSKTNVVESRGKSNSSGATRDEKTKDDVKGNDVALCTDNLQEEGKEGGEEKENKDENNEKRRTTPTVQLLIHQDTETFLRNFRNDNDKDEPVLREYAGIQSTKPVDFQPLLSAKFNWERVGRDDVSQKGEATLILQSLQVPNDNREVPTVFDEPAERILDVLVGARSESGSKTERDRGLAASNHEEDSDVTTDENGTRNASCRIDDADAKSDTKVVSKKNGDSRCRSMIRNERRQKNVTPAKSSSSTDIDKENISIADRKMYKSVETPDQKVSVLSRNDLVLVSVKHKEDSDVSTDANGKRTMSRRTDDAGTKSDAKVAPRKGGDSRCRSMTRNEQRKKNVTYVKSSSSIETNKENISIADRKMYKSVETPDQKVSTLLDTGIDLDLVSVNLEQDSDVTTGANGTTSCPTKDAGAKNDAKVVPKKDGDSRSRSIMRNEQRRKNVTSARSSTSTESNKENISNADRKMYKTVEILNQKMSALLDTGSDLHLMSAKRYVELGAPELNGPAIEFRGVGVDRVRTIGSFRADANIDQETYSLVVHVVPYRLLRYELLLGAGLLRQAEIRFEDGKATISKRNRQADDVFEGYDEAGALSANAVESTTDSDRVERSDEIELAEIENDAVREKLRRMAEEYRPRRACETSVKMEIVPKDETPVYQRSRWMSPEEREDARRQVAKWLKEGIVRVSTSVYGSPVVVIMDESGDSRICVDYRALNRKVARDRLVQPAIEDQLNRLRGFTVFSTLVLKDKYFRVPIHENSCKYTAFLVPDGHYEFLRAPFGFCNSLIAFQRHLHLVFKDLLAEGVLLIYVDQPIVLARSEKDALINLKRALDVASDHDLRPNWRRCEFLRRRVEFYGFVVEEGRAKPSERRTLAVTKFPTPSSAENVESFLSLAGYFRKFITDYSTLARPLANTTKDGAKFQFGAEERRAFERLKLALIGKPLMKLYRACAETEVHVGASCLGYGAVLLQRDDIDKAFHPIYYASWKTTESEERYAGYELEVLAVVRSLMAFRIYLLGTQFKLVTDCRAFAAATSERDLCARVARWALPLEELNYTVEHRPSKSTRHVNALGRNPQFAMLMPEDEDGLIARLGRAQREDDVLKWVFRALEHRPYDDFVVRSRILYKECNGELLLVVPKAMQRDMVKRTHERGHFSVGTTEQLLRREFWFDRVRNKVEKVVRSCIGCLLTDRRHGTRMGAASAVPNSWIKADLPLEVYHVDHLGPVRTARKSYIYVLSVTDAFTKFVWLYPAKTSTTGETVDRLRKQAAIFGNPRRIVADKRVAFVSSEFRDYCSEEGIRLVLRSPGVAHGPIERLNDCVISIVAKLTSSTSNPEDWYRCLETAQRYLNSSSDRVLGATPFELLTGRTMRLKEDPSVRRLIEREITCAEEGGTTFECANDVPANSDERNPMRYRVRELVGIQRSRITARSKIRTQTLGPYRVTEVLRGDRYLLEKMGVHDGPRRTCASIDRLVPWISSEMEGGQEATKDDEERQVKGEEEEEEEEEEGGGGEGNAEEEEDGRVDEDRDEDREGEEEEDKENERTSVGSQQLDRKTEERRRSIASAVDRSNAKRNGNRFLGQGAVRKRSSKS